MSTIGDRIRTARRKLGLTQGELAVRCTASGDKLTVGAVSNWENGHNAPSAGRLAVISAVLEVEPAWLLSTDEGGVSSKPDTLPPSNVRNEDPIASQSPPKLPAMHEMPMDVPVYGTAAGSLGEGAFALEEAVVDYVRRPPGIASARDVYALYIEGDSMEPRYFPGDLVFVSPRRPARSGDFVIVQVQFGEHENIQSYCKRLVRKTPGSIELEQYNPKTNLDFAADNVLAVHRILTVSELAGI